MTARLEHAGDQGVQKSILAVIVLYKVAAAESQAFVSLRDLLAQDRKAADDVELIICDNTPYQQPRPPGFNGLYVHDGRNDGLAKRYNFAIARARQRGAEWLMLLDQDTTVNASYLREALERTALLAHDTGIAAVVPKLAKGSQLFSPHVPLYANPPFEIDMSLSGVPKRRLQVFNSGALLRVRRLEAIGGFPEHFWLDYLDHAMFHLLQEDGSKVYVMEAVLQHELSAQGLLGQRDPGPLSREWNTLEASADFFRRYGTRRERVLHCIDLLRMAFGIFRRGRYLQGLRVFGVALDCRPLNVRGTRRNAE